MIKEKVKLVIWDLDDTFWQGTLEEGGITPIDRNIEMVRELAGRGIISSICSKNDYERTQSKLQELGIWDHFVFPVISFDPKGKSVAEMIEGAALRPENVLFIDDNPMNIEEVKFFNTGIMAAHPADVLHLLLDHPHLAGKPDPGLTRLKQYQFLQRKAEERDTSALSNEEFLRASNIRIRIDYDVEANFDRVVELINRTNQLNYTKKRLETTEEIEEFRVLLNGFGYHAGCVWATDNYGDYGLIGFYLQRRRANLNKLIHFVFSCRTMHMGIEQYVYETLGRPEIEIAFPVSYGLDTYQDIDWIQVGGEQDGVSASGTGNRKLLLLGGCDLLQLATYCSSQRVEFVNRAQGKINIRYDDPSFIISDREAIRKSRAIRKIPCWTYEDAIRFDETLAESQLILISLWSGMNGRYFRTRRGVKVRLTKPDTIKIEKEFPNWFRRNFEELPLDDSEKQKLILASLDSVGVRSGDTQIFLLSCYTLYALLEEQRVRRIAYNELCRDYCNEHPDKFHFVNIDAIVQSGDVIGNGHFTRSGYFAIARHILSIADSAGIPNAESATQDQQPLAAA